MFMFLISAWRMEPMLQHEPIRAYNARESAVFQTYGFPYFQFTKVLSGKNGWCKAI